MVQCPPIFGLVIRLAEDQLKRRQQESIGGCLVLSGHWTLDHLQVELKRPVCKIWHDLSLLDWQNLQCNKSKLVFLPSEWFI